MYCIYCVLCVTKYNKEKQNLFIEKVSEVDTSTDILKSTRECRLEALRSAAILDDGSVRWRMRRLGTLLVDWQGSL